MAAAVRPLFASPRRAFFVLLPLGALVLLVLSVLAYTMIRGDTSVRTNSLVHGPAPAFTFTTFDGKQVSLASLRGKPVVVNFWGSWCVPCRDEAPVLSQAWQKYQPQGVQFVGIAIWDKPDAARAFAQGAGATWLNGLDGDGKIAIDYGVYGVPETFFISRDGILEDRYVGPLVGVAGSTRLDASVEGLLHP